MKSLIKLDFPQNKEVITFIYLEEGLFSQRRVMEKNLIFHL